VLDALVSSIYLKTYLLCCHSISVLQLSCSMDSGLVYSLKAHHRFPLPRIFNDDGIVGRSKSLLSFLSLRIRLQLHWEEPLSCRDFRLCP
jgi:hypothetical protein